MPKSSPYRSEGNRDINITFDPGDFKPVTPYTEDLKDEYQEAQNALQALRQREEQIRRKAEQLEEITIKEEDFSHGRSEVVNRLEEYLALLDREAADAQQIAKECIATHQRFHNHLNSVLNLRPEASDRSDRNIQLDNALRQLEAAEDEVAEAMPLIEHLSGKRQKRSAPFVASSSAAAQPQGDFLFWLKAGIAFTLPVMTIAIVITIVFLYLK